MTKAASHDQLKETLWQLVAAIPPGRVASHGQLVDYRRAP